MLCNHSWTNINNPLTVKSKRQPNIFMRYYVYNLYKAENGPAHTNQVRKSSTMHVLKPNNFETNLVILNLSGLKWFWYAQLWVYLNIY